MKISIPNLSLVVLIGPSGSGKSTFARRHFRPTEILSSDACRAMVGDDENDQAVTKDAFEVLRFIAGKRLALGRLTVIDATNVQPEARKPLVELARQYHCLPVAIVLDLPERICQERNAGRPGPGLRPARRPQPEGAIAAVAAGAPQGGLPPRLRAGDARGGRGGRRRTSAPLERQEGRARPVRHHRRCPRLLRRAGGVARAARLCRVIPGRRRSPLGKPGVRPSRGPQGRVPRRPGGPRPPHPGRGAAGAEHGPPRLGPLRPRQPRHEAAEGSCRARTSRSPTGWPTLWPRSTPSRPSQEASSATSWPTSSTGWSATTSSTTASWSSPTPG